MASDIATRIKSKLLRRRPSSRKTPSFLSSRSVPSSLDSQGASPGASASASHSKTASSLGPSPSTPHRDQVSSLSSTSRQPPSSSEGDEGSSLLIVPRSKDNEDSATPSSTDRKDSGLVVVVDEPDTGDFPNRTDAGRDSAGAGSGGSAHGGAGGGGAGGGSAQQEQVQVAGANGDPPQTKVTATTSTKPRAGPRAQGNDQHLQLYLQPAQSQSQPPSQPSPSPPSSPSHSPTSTGAATSLPPPANSQSKTSQASRLHSIDESSGAQSPTTAPDKDDPNHDHYADTNADGSVNLPQADASLARPNRPGSLELASSSTNNNTDGHHPNDASLTVYAVQHHASNANTPAGASFTLAPDSHRRQSLVSQRHSSFIKSLLQGPAAHDADETGSLVPSGDYDTDMVTTRKLWVKRPHASPTLITINDDDLVDDVRDMILRKYANSLGRTFDSPDLTLRICPRDPSQKERFLGPEEHMSRTIDSHFPGGQTVDEALVIDIPRRTPKPSPRPTGLYPTDDGRPSEAGEGYFPPMVGGGGGGGGLPSPHHQVLVPVQPNGAVPHSISVLGTGHIPPIPSPGGTRQRPHRDRGDRPRLARQHTTSPNILANGSQGPAAASDGMQHYVHRPSHSRAHSNSSEIKGRPQSPNHPMPTSPVQQHAQARVSTPPPRVSSPRPSTNRIKRTKKASEYQNLGAQGLLSGGVPPISVLIVEDNPINLKLLEQFVKKLKVRWQTAMNGRDAVKKWRAGGFHLVLMDIQLPVMNGLDATREIRRLERVNSIGVFSSSQSSVQQEEENSEHEIEEKDRLDNRDLFKSPVIIVALTASSLQSDRHQALAAGCNDFLTKVSFLPFPFLFLFSLYANGCQPVNFDWLERKVMEWGCMQALIDFDGWRRWKDFSQIKEKEASQKAAAAAAATKHKKKKSSLSSST